MSAQDLDPDYEKLLKSLMTRKQVALAKLHREVDALKSALAALPKDTRQTELPISTVKKRG